MPKPILKVIYVAIFLLFTFVSYKSFQSHIFTFHFVDEDENIIAGYYMGKGEKFYQAIFSHKQPLPAVISMYEQKIQKPNSLYLLIKRHRELIYFYSLIFSLGLIIFFGLPALIFSIFFELAKPLLLGNLFLYESLVVFPLVYTFGYIHKYLLHKKTSLFEKIIFSISLSSIPFLQFTLIPYYLMVIIIIAVYKNTFKSFFTFYLLPFTFLFIFCSFFVDYGYYVDNTINAIRTIYAGGNSVTEIILYSFLRPFAAIWSINKSVFGRFTGILSLGYLLSFLYLFLTQKNFRKPLVIIYILLGLSSLRVVYPDKTIYSGFHGLPWFGALLFITIYQFYLVIRCVLSLRAKRSQVPYGTWRSNLVVLISFCLFLIAFCYSGIYFVQDYYRPADRETDWYVNYSRFYDYGQVVRVLSQKGDELLVLPVEQLIYWQSGLPHASRFLYGYVFGIPKYRKELFYYMEKKPPAFIYDETNFDILNKWRPFYQIIYKEETNTPLYIRKDKIPLLKKWQLNEIKRLKFSIN